MAGRSRDLLGLAAVCLPPLAAVLLGARGPVAATLNLGPNDQGYLAGFAPFAEISGETGTRWSGYDARVDLPLRVEGPARVSYRVARMLPQTAAVEVGVAGRPVDAFRARGGTWHQRSAAFAGRGEPATLSFEVDSHDRRGLGLRFDWVRLEVERGGVLRLRGRAAWWPVLLAGGLFVLLRASAFGPAGGTLGAGVVGLGVAAWALRDPLALSHVLGHAAPGALGLGALAAVFARRRPGGRWAVAAFLVSYLAKAVAVFHPLSYYPDVQNAQRYVFALAEGEGSLAERNVAAQREVNAAYPRIIGGKAYAMPYSPLLFMPFTSMPREPGLVQDALRHVGVAAAAAEVLVVFALGAALFGPGAAVGAALVAAVLPPLYSRLLYAMWATAFGHLLDTLTVLAALAYVQRPDGRRRLGGLFLAATAAVLSYVSSLFNVTAFLGLLAVLHRRRAVPLLAAAATAAGITIALLYADFTATFVREILPAIWAGSEGGAGPGGGPLPALARIPWFYGYGYPALAVGGLLLARGRLPPAGGHVVSAYGLTFTLLVAMRAFGGGLFRDLKEITFVGPLVALLVGFALAELWRTGRSGRLAVVLLAAGLLAFSAERYSFFLRTQVSPVTSAPAGLGAGSGTVLSGGA